MTTLEQLKEKIFSKFHKDTWEIKTLGEIATEIFSGSEITKAQLGTGDYPAIRFDQIFNSEISIEKCASFVNLDLIRNKKYCEWGDIVIATTSNTKEYIGKACAYLVKDKCLVGNDVKIIKHNQNPKYLSYLLSSSEARKQFLELSQDSTVSHLYTKDIKQIKIPLPSLEIQQRIVEFLDRYIELERELEMRKKQYEYYRDNEFKKGIERLNWEMKKIEEIAMEIISGNEVTRTQLKTGDHPAIKCGDINSSLPLQFEECISFVNFNILKKPKYFKKGDVLISKMSNKSSTVGTAATYLGNSKCLLGGDIDAIRHNQNPQYLAHALSTAFARNQIENLAQESTVFHLYTKDIKQIKIPLPPIDEQIRVAENLDKLYRIVHDLKEGIPFLIQKYREEYETYRDLLLEK